ncbi:MAG: protein kinase [Ilumatobacteraceae bacterium]
MPSERIQRQVDLLLDEAGTAMSHCEWDEVAQKVRAALAMDPENVDAPLLLRAAEANLGGTTASVADPGAVPVLEPATSLPTSFVAGRYHVRRFLGEGGKKKVFLAHDESLDRDVAFALIKTEGLDAIGRERVVREAQTMGRLGSHPHVVTIFEIGEDGGRPYVVTELLGGGDVEGLLKGEADVLPLTRTLEIAKDVCRGLAFAHANQVVHRDLKPGNVWLTADGVAKIGDFGLAVSLDRSRLTQHGMMVGTVSYMPPEQALGGEITPQADLYSLGAMLYEFVTGKPPFQADDPTAVISQHINMPPVAPSWNSDHCPPELETLIMRLLAKVPTDRPTSAREALEVLERVDPHAKSASHSDSSANPLDRLAQGAFVGREGELKRLRHAFDQAYAGRGSVVALVGEPGIGKTRTTQELETYARLRGALVLWGRTHESAGAPAYWPWLQVGNAWGAAVDLLGSGGGRLQGGAGNVFELVRLFPALRQLPGFIELPDEADAEAAQFRLFDAYAQFMRNQSADQPWLVILDDLHWADKPSLQLLQYVARELPNMRVMVVCTYRDTELSRVHPLSETLVSLNRESDLLRLPLRGLVLEDVAKYIRTSTNTEPRPELVRRIFEETEGNPFFLSEVVKLMAQEGTLTKESVSDIAIPDGVKEALGRRLNLLSEETNEVLTVAAVVGREFTYNTLSLLGARDENDLFGCIEKAVKARVVEEIDPPGHYRFTHALMQETLLGELSTTRRVRLHGQVGEALEQQWGLRADEQAPWLAAHFVEAATLTDRHARKAVHYSRLAADAAAAQYAWNEAARHYENCLSLITATQDALGQDEAALLVNLGICRREDLDWEVALRCLMRAISIFESRGDAINIARATLEAQLIPTVPTRKLQLVENALVLLGDQDPYLEAMLLLRQLGSIGEDLSLDRRDAIRKRAEEIIEEHGLEDARVWLIIQDGSDALNELQFETAFERFSAARELRQDLHRARPALLGFGLARTLAAPVDEGQVALEAALTTIRSIHHGFTEGSILLRLSGIAFAKGDYEKWESLLEEVSGLANNYFPALQRAAAKELVGDLDAAISLLPDPALAGGFPPWVAQIRAARTRVRFLAGDVAGARAELEQFVAAQPASVSPYSVGRFFPLTELDDCVAVIGDDSLVRQHYTELIRCAPVKWDPCAPRGADRIRGTLAKRLGLLDESTAHYQQGLEWATAGSLKIETGRCLQGLAAIADERGDHNRANEYLDRAGTLFSQNGAKLYLDQVITKKKILKA